MIGAHSDVPAEQRAALELENAKYPEALKLLPLKSWVDRFAGLSPKLIPARVWRSRCFLVQGFKVSGGTALWRLSINRTTLDGGRWIDGISWDDLQRLKAEAGFADQDAVEIYPRDSDLVNVANMRHLWILEPGSLPFAWRRGK